MRAEPEESGAESTMVALDVSTMVGARAAMLAYVKTIGERLRAEREAQGVTQEELGRVAGVSKAAIGAIETGATKSPRPETLFPIASKLSVSPEWLITGRGSKRAADRRGVEDLRPILAWETAADLPEGQFGIIPRYDVWASMGKGNKIPDDVAERLGDAFRSDFLRNAGWSPKTHFSMRAFGDSMIEAGIRDGWSVVVDTTDTEVVPGEVFAILYDGDLQVKYLELLRDGGLQVISANSAHPVWKKPLTLDAERAAQLVQIMGRVVFVSGLIGNIRRS
jgi:phage repressor protein C with HTH and peptisase S24 domain